MSFFAHLYQSYGPWFTPKFRFHSISREQIDWFSPNFIYAFILTRSNLGLLHLSFHTFVPELWPLIYAKISFPLNISRNYLTDYHQILYMHSYWQDLAWDCCMSLFAHLYQGYNPWFTPKFYFRSLSWEQIDRIAPNFIYAFILSRSTLGLLHIIFSHICTSVMALDLCKKGDVHQGANLAPSGAKNWKLLFTNFTQLVY